MWKLIASCLCILSVPADAFAGVAGIKSMSQNSNGLFNVTCFDGSLETVVAPAISENSVCKLDNQPLQQKSNSVVCTGSGSIAYITRISDNKILGNGHISLEDCQRSTKASSNSVVCTGSGSIAYITRISDEKILGNGHISLEDCQRSTKVL